MLALLPLWYVAFLLSLTCHEAAHAWAARRGGDDTAYLAGQVSLNPWPHVRREPFGTVLVPLITYFANNGWMMGWASAPYDPHWEARHPRRAAAMSAAGPAANLIIAAGAFAALKAGIAAGWWEPPLRSVADQLVAVPPGAAPLLEGVSRFLSILLTLNIVLGVFNLIPLPPLDGISVLAGLVPPIRHLYLQARAHPVTALLGILVAWKVSGFVIRPVWLAVVRALHGL